MSQSRSNVGALPQRCLTPALAVDVLGPRPSAPVSDPADAQVVTRHGKEVAVVLGIDDYRRLRGEEKDFKQFLLGPPYVDVDLPIERSTEPPREIDLT